MPDLNFVFAGSPPFAARILTDLMTSGFHPRAVYTQPDRPSGRGRKINPSAVKALAGTADLEVEQPLHFKDAKTVNRLASFAPEVVIVVAYGLILPKPVLAIPPMGCINVHASLLPRWRGAAPIERAYMDGDAETGISIMRMDEALDAGPVYSISRVKITEGMPIATLEHELARGGASALINTLHEFIGARDNSAPFPEPSPQPTEGLTYAAKLTAIDRHLDFSRPALENVRRINALASRMPVRCQVNGRGFQLLTADVQASKVSTPHPPGTITVLDKNGLYIQCAIDQLRLTQIRPEFGKGSRLDPNGMLAGYGQFLVPGTLVV